MEQQQTSGKNIHVVRLLSLNTARELISFASDIHGSALTGRLVDDLSREIKASEIELNNSRAIGQEGE